MTERLQSLHQFYEEEPTDPFNAYALAIEYLLKNPEKARLYLDELLELHPDYLPTYYHAGAFYAALGQIEKAEEIYETGIALALSQNNQKALRELRGAYQLFLDELEE